MREVYVMECHWAGATGFNFSKSDAPKDPKAPKVEPTLPRWSEWRQQYCVATQGMSKPIQVSDEELNEILYGDRNFKN